MANHAVRFGVLGHGAFGRCHAQAIEAVDGAELAAIAEVSEDGLAQARSDHPTAAVYRDYAELLANESIDVVNVVLPNHLHLDASTKALARGRHLLLEKPMTLNVADCRKLIGQAADCDCMLALGHEFRLSSLWGRVKQLIDEGLVGTPKYVLVELSRHPYFAGADGWRHDAKRVGDWILEEPIHFFDLARWYLECAGEPVSLFALASSREGDRPELQDNVSALIKHANGAYATVTQTLSAFEHHQTVKVTGTKGAIWARWSGAQGRSLDPEFMLKTCDGETIRTETIAETPGELYELRAQIEAMVAAVRTGRCGLPDGMDGLWAVALCEAAGISAREGREVRLAELMAGDS